MITIEIKKFAEKVAGKKKEDIIIFTLSTCVWCNRTKRLLKSMGIEYSYIDVDLLEENARDEIIKEFERWSPEHDFPTIVVDGKRCIIGYHEDRIKEL